MMIGQTKVWDKINRLLDNRRFPSFIILIAPQGYGKRTLARNIAIKLQATYAPCGAKVDEIREVIDTANRVKDRVLYCIEDSNSMSLIAKNAMLKVTEEPPENAYFCLCVTDEKYLLPTIKSRGTVFNLESYTEDELKLYYSTLDERTIDEDKICKIANCPGDINLLLKYGNEFLEYVDLVIDNISEVESANAFKSSNKLALKNEDGYDLHLFFSAFNWKCIDRMTEDPLRYSHGVCATLPYEMKSTQPGVNKQQLYDMWVFKIREVWL